MQPLKRLFGFTLCIGLSVHSASAEVKHAGVVVWDTSAPTIIDANNIPENRSQIVFIRLPDTKFISPASHTNIAIDGHYQISLGKGYTSSAIVCPGNRELSVQFADNKSNDLSINTQYVYVKPRQIHFYQVVTTSDHAVDFVPLDLEDEIENQPLMDYIATLPSQTHQISRVKTDCPLIPSPPMFIPIASDNDSKNLDNDSNNDNNNDVDKVSSDNTATQNDTPEPMFIKIDKPMVLDILFEFNKATISPQSLPEIAKLAAFISSNHISGNNVNSNHISSNNASVIIEGHTDSKGSPEYNLQLSQARADAVKQLLITKYDVAASQIDAIGYGDTQPVASNDTKAGRQLNRRVVAVVVPQK